MSCELVDYNSILGIVLIYATLQYEPVQRYELRQRGPGGAVWFRLEPAGSV